MATAKQIAARKLFAERAKAGLFSKSAKRRKNPVKPGQYGVAYTSAVSGKRTVTHFNTKTAAGKAAVNLYKEGAKNVQMFKFTEGVGAVDIDWRIYKRNPVVKRSGVSDSRYISRPSQITKRTPSKRLKSRRAENLENLGSGYFPNPNVKYKNQAEKLSGESRVGYSVHFADRPYYHAIAWFSKKDDAIEVAQDVATRKNVQMAVSRVQIYFGDE